MRSLLIWTLILMLPSDSLWALAPRAQASSLADISVQEMRDKAQRNQDLEAYKQNILDVQKAFKKGTLLTRIVAALSLKPSYLSGTNKNSWKGMSLYGSIDPHAQGKNNLEKPGSELIRKSQSDQVQLEDIEHEQLDEAKDKGWRAEMQMIEKVFKTRSTTLLPAARHHKGVTLFNVPKNSHQESRDFGLLMDLGKDDPWAAFEEDNYAGKAYDSQKEREAMLYEYGNVKTLKNIQKGIARKLEKRAVAKQKRLAKTQGQFFSRNELPLKTPEGREALWEELLERGYIQEFGRASRNEKSFIRQGNHIRKAKVTQKFLELESFQKLKLSEKYLTLSKHIFALLHKLADPEDKPLEHNDVFVDIQKKYLKGIVLKDRLSKKESGYSYGMPKSLSTHREEAKRLRKLALALQAYIYQEYSLLLPVFKYQEETNDLELYEIDLSEQEREELSAGYPELLDAIDRSNPQTEDWKGFVHKESAPEEEVFQKKQEQPHKQEQSMTRSKEDQDLSAEVLAQIKAYPRDWQRSGEFVQSSSVDGKFFVLAHGIGGARTADSRKLSEYLSQELQKSYAQGSSTTLLKMLEDVYKRALKDKVGPKGATSLMILRFKGQELDVLNLGAGRLNFYDAKGQPKYISASSQGPYDPWANPWSKDYYGSGYFSDQKVSEATHDFHVPVQLLGELEEGQRMEDFFEPLGNNVELKLQVSPEDILLFQNSGVYDNLEQGKIDWLMRKFNNNFKELLEEIESRAYEAATDPTIKTPFQDNLPKHIQEHYGGRPDDIASFVFQMSKQESSVQVEQSRSNFMRKDQQQGSFEQVSVKSEMNLVRLAKVLHQRGRLLGRKVAEASLKNLENTSGLSSLISNSATGSFKWKGLDLGQPSSHKAGADIDPFGWDILTSENYVPAEVDRRYLGWEYELHKLHSPGGFQGQSATLLPQAKLPRGTRFFRDDSVGVLIKPQMKNVHAVYAKNALTMNYENWEKMLEDLQGDPDNLKTLDQLQKKLRKSIYPSFLSRLSEFAKGRAMGLLRLFASPRETLSNFLKDTSDWLYFAYHYRTLEPNALVSQLDNIDFQKKEDREAIWSELIKKGYIRTVKILPRESRDVKLKGERALLTRKFRNIIDLNNFKLSKKFEASKEAIYFGLNKNYRPNDIYHVHNEVIMDYKASDLVALFYPEQETQNSSLESTRKKVQVTEKFQKKMRLRALGLQAYLYERWGIYLPIMSYNVVSNRLTHQKIILKPDEAEDLARQYPDLKYAIDRLHPQRVVAPEVQVHKQKLDLERTYLPLRQDPPESKYEVDYHLAHSKAYPKPWAPKGENVWAMSADQKFWVLADGVGGARSEDSRKLAQALAEESVKIHEQSPGLSLQKILSRSYQKALESKVAPQGAATILLARFVGDQVEVLRIGNQNMLILDYQGKFRSDLAKSTQAFNAPAYLPGTVEQKTEDTWYYSTVAEQVIADIQRNSSGSSSQFKGVLPGDIILTVSDGLTSNLYTSQISKAVQRGRHNPKRMLESLTDYAYQRSLSDKDTPFSDAIGDEFKARKGGKKDDITVLAFRFNELSTHS